MKKQKIALTILTLLISIQMFGQNLIPFERKGLWGYQDSIGNEIIEPKYGYVGKFKEGFAVVILNDFASVINRKGETVIPFKYKYIRYIGKGKFQFGYRTTYLGEYQMGIITKSNEIIIEPNYSFVNEENQFYHVRTQIDSIIGENEIGDVRTVKTMHGLFDLKGIEIIPCKYDYLDWRGDSLIVLRKGKNHALFNIHGEQLTEFKYMVIGDFEEGHSKVREGNKFGFLLPNGQELAPIEYDWCYPFKNGIAMIRIGKGWGAIDKKGEIIIEAKLPYDKAIEEIEKRTQ